MNQLKSAFTSMSVKDIGRAKDFYSNKLGLSVTMDGMPNMAMFDCGGGTQCMLYQKDDHQPATHTVLNLLVGDIEKAVGELSSAGVEFNKDDSMNTDDKGIATLDDIKMAWFNDSEGNFVSLIQRG